LAEGKQAELLTYVFLGTVVSTTCLRLLIRRDKTSLLIVLGFCISLMATLNSLFSKQTGYHIHYWSTATLYYVILLGLSVLGSRAYYYLAVIPDGAYTSKA